MRAVAAKRLRLDDLDSPRKIRSHIEKRPIPAVVGPAGELYIIDRHHLTLALYRAGIRDVSVALLADFSALSRAAFWALMERNGMLHPYNGLGLRIHPSRLPRSIGDLGHDPYRDLAWSVRRLGGFKKTITPFSEFCWANFFRSRIPTELVWCDYSEAVRRALWLTASRSARSLPGYAA